MQRFRLLVAGALTAALPAVAAVLVAPSLGAQESNRYPYDPVCPWGRLSDGRGMIVRCLKREEKQQLLVGAPCAPAAGSGAAAASTSAIPSATATAAESAEELMKTLGVTLVSVTPDQGKLSGENKLGAPKDKYVACVAKNGGVEREDAEVHVRFLVGERGRAEGVSVAKRVGINEKAAKCVADVVDRRPVGTPDAPMVGATAVFKFSRVKPK